MNIRWIVKCFSKYRFCTSKKRFFLLFSLLPSPITADIFNACKNHLPLFTGKNRPRKSNFLFFYNYSVIVYGFFFCYYVENVPSILSVRFISSTIFDDSYVLRCISRIIKYMCNTRWRPCSYSYRYSSFKIPSSKIWVVNLNAY